MAIEKSLYEMPQGIEQETAETPEIEIEIEPDEEMIDGGLEDSVEVEVKIENEFDANQIGRAHV
mgnify:CR=1 FL=1